MTDSVFAVCQMLCTLLATYLFHSTCLLVAVWVGLRISRVQNVHVIEQLWKLAAVGALITAPLQVTISAGKPVLDFTLGVRPTLASPSQVTSTTGVASVAGQRVSVTHRRPRQHPLSSRAAATTSETTSHQPALSPNVARQTDARPGNHSRLDPSVSDTGGSGARWTAAMVCSVATLSAAGLALLRLVLQSLLFRRHVRDCVPVDSGMVRETLGRVLRRAKISREIKLEESTKLREPVAFGLRRWRIVLPLGIEEKLNAEELRALLGHEVAHLVRGDTAWLWVGRVLCGCFAFQPLNFLARRQWQDAAEFLCDDWAVRNDANPFSLATCLTQIAQWRLDRRDLAGAMAAAGTTAAVTQRVERLLATDRSPPLPTPSRTLQLIAGCAVLALIFAGPRATWGDGGAAQVTPIRTLSAEPIRRDAVAAELEIALSELEACQQVLSTADSLKLRKMVPRLRERGAAIRRRGESLFKRVFVSTTD